MVDESSSAKHWEPKEIERQLIAIPRMIRVVGVSKLLIGLVALSLLSVVILLPLLHKDDSAIRIAFNQMPETSEVTKPVMLNPRYESIDGDNQPFMIRAKEAVQEDAETVKLLDVQADISLNKGSWLALRAARGFLQIASKKMLLEGSVQLFSDEGYELRTPSAAINMATNSASGERSIQGQGPFGSVSAGSFVIEGESQRLLFDNKVKLVIYP